MTVRDLFESAGYHFENEMPDGEVSGIATDSRAVRPGNVFIALRGIHADGHQYIRQALSSGALMAVGECRMPGVYTVPDSREACARLYDAYFGHPGKDLRLFAVTGTNGKTTTAAMLSHILNTAGSPTGLIGTLGAFLNGENKTLPNHDVLANMTTPDPAELYRILAGMRDAGARGAVLEVSSHALYFKKTAPLFFKKAVFTNLSPEHLDLHGDMETYYQVKKSLFDSCAEAVVSTFDDYGKRLSKEIGVPAFQVGEEMIGELREGAWGSSFRFCDTRFLLPLPGRFVMEDAVLAAATAIREGIPAETAAAVLADFHGVKGRMEAIAQNPLGIRVFVDYAHTPDALSKLLLNVRRFCPTGGRILLLFGCGGDRDRTKRGEMGGIASRLADFTVLTSDNCRSEDPMDILAEIKSGMLPGKACRVIPDREEAIAFAVEEARSGDILVLAGKGHEEYEIRGTKRLPFSEREIAARCMAERVKRETHEN